jgi:predicted nucleic-acid-binding protein
MGVHVGSRRGDMGSYSAVRSDSRGIATAIDMLLHHRDLTIQEPDSVAAALEQYRNRAALGFSDCLILETARKAGHLPLGTFDHNLSKLDGVEGL